MANKPHPPILIHGRTTGNINVPLQADASGVLQTSASGGGGGASTIADGADVTQGAIADAAVAAGAAGTLSAKLRSISRDIASYIAQILDFDTGGGTANTPVIGIALPASGGPVAGGTTTNPLNVASGFSVKTYDYVSYASASTTDTYVFKTGGSGGTTQATIVVTWTDSTKTVLSNVTKT